MKKNGLVYKLYGLTDVEIVLKKQTYSEAGWKYKAVGRGNGCKTQLLLHVFKGCPCFEAFSDWINTLRKLSRVVDFDSWK